MISICFVHFDGGLDLRHLDAAWFSLSKQDFTGVNQVCFFDNNSPDSIDAIAAVLYRYPMPVPVHYEFAKHGDATKTQSWSVNHVCDTAKGPQILFTRSDYILDFTTVARFRHVSENLPFNARQTAFITSYAYHMAFDERGDQRIVGFRDIEQYGWREHGPQVLLEKVNGWKVDSSHLDAGVWLTQKALWALVGGLDERLSAWGYQQTVFQRALAQVGVHFPVLPEYLFFHQHHAAPRSYDVAKVELAEIGLSVAELQEFRPDVGAHSGNVCDELDK